MCMAGLCPSPSKATSIQSSHPDALIQSLPSGKAPALTASLWGLNVSTNAWGASQLLSKAPPSCSSSAVPCSTHLASQTLGRDPAWCPHGSLRLPSRHSDLATRIQ